MCSCLLENENITEKFKLFEIVPYHLKPDLNVWAFASKMYESEMRYCQIGKEMSSLYFGLPVFCLLEGRVLEFDTQPPLRFQNTSSPKYNDDISLLI
jgi:hypothetical protein